MSPTPDTWPELRYDDYRETRDTLHMYAQIVGKLRLGLKPPLAQWGHAPLALDADGFTTGPLWVGDGVLSVSLDLLRHEARLQRSDGRRRTVPLGGAVADFYAAPHGRPGRARCGHRDQPHAAGGGHAHRLRP